VEPDGAALAPVTLKYGAGEATELEGFQIIDDKTVQFTLARPNAPFLAWAVRATRPDQQCDPPLTQQDLERISGCYPMVICFLQGWSKLMRSWVCQ